MMQFRRQSMFMLFLAILVGCSPIPEIPVSVTPAPPRVSSATLSVAPVPSVTVTPTLTPFPPLSGDKPYLVLQELRFAPGYRSNTLLMYDHDGSGRDIFALPPDCYPNLRGLDVSFSPDGKWLVCYTGAIGFGSTPDNLPVTLHIVSMDDGSVRKVADVVRLNYQEKLARIAQELPRREPKNYDPEESKDWIFGALTSAFFNDMNSMDWSPDSKYLAFAAQIEGDSLDVYTYTVETGEIRRLEDSLRNVGKIRWSPDGDYIVFQNSRPGQIYVDSTLHAVKVDGDLVKEPTTLASWWFGNVVGWLSPTELIATDGTDTGGRHGVTVINIDTGQKRDLWQKFYGELIVDYKNELIVLNTNEFGLEDDWGIYFINFDGRTKKIADGWYYTQNVLNLASPIFVVVEDANPHLLKGITLEGVMSELDLPRGVYTVSPDGLWIFIYNEAGAYLYDENKMLVQSYELPGIGNVLWRPDSQGFFFEYQRALYYLSILIGEPIYVDGCIMEDCYSLLRSAAWLP